MRKKGLAYLAGRMRGLEDFGFPLFDKGKRILEQHGYEVVSPADMDRGMGFDPRGLKGTDEELARLNFSTADALRRDFAEILNCTHLALLPNWRDSGGARKEKMLAETIGLDVLDVNLDAGLVVSHQDDSILDEAKRLVYGDRNAQYGPAIRDFSRTAAMWTVLFGELLKDGASFGPQHVPLGMIAVKLSREVHRPKRDSMTDLCGYAATYEQVRGVIGGWD